MTQEQKIKLQQLLLAKIEKLGISQNDAAKRIGVSAATISNIINNKFDSITDAWKIISQWVGNGKWQVVETANVKRIGSMCKHAQTQGITKAVSFRQGSGKSEGVKYYADNNKNVFYLEVEPHYTKKTFLQKLSRAMGLSIHNSISEMVDNIIDKLNSLTSPLVILDEFDQLSENVLPFFKTFYNKTTSGFVLVGGEHFNKRITRGVSNAKQSYCEIYSRLGAEFLPLHPTNAETIQAICQANGIYDPATIEAIAKDAKGDLRRVKSEVEKIHLQTKQVPQGN